MEPFLLVGLVVVVFMVVVISGQIVTEKKRRAAWQEIADRLRLHYERDQIHGELRGVVVRVWIEVRGGGKQQSYWTVLTASIAGEVPLGLRLSPERFFAKMLKVTGATKDIQVDLPGVDEKLLVNGTDPDEVRRWAQRADISRALVDLVALNEHFEVAPHQLKLDLSGSIADAAAIEAHLETLVNVARTLSGKGYGALIDDGSW